MAKKRLRKEVVRNVGWDFFSKVIVKFGGLIFTILIARLLQPEGYGLYVLATSIALFFMSFFSSGVDRTLNRFISYAVKKDKKKTGNYFRYITKVKFLLSFFTLILILILAWPLSNLVFKKPALFLPLIIAAFYSFIFYFDRFFSFIFYSIKKVRYLTIKGAIFELGRITLSVIVFLFIIEIYRVEGIIAAASLSALIAILFSLYYIKKLKPELFQKSKTIDKKRINKFIIYLFFGGISLVFISYIDVIMLGIFLPSSYVGYYKVAFSLVVGVIALFAFSQLFLPYFTQFKKDKIGPALSKVIYYLLIFSMPAFFGFLILSKYFVKAFFGQSYVVAAPILQVLAILIIITPLTQLFSSLFEAREKPKYYVKTLLILTVLNVILNYIFISQFLKISQIAAAIGAGIATVSTRFLYLFILIFLTKNKINIDVKIKFFKPLFASIVMSLFLLYSLTFIKNMNLFYGIIEVLFGAFIYFITMLLIKGIKKQDFELLKLLKKS